MNRDWNYIEKEGKQLKTVDDFKNWYVRTEKAYKKQDSNFDERKFEEETRKEIIALRDSILTDNAESKKYKFILLSFIGEFLNKKAFVLNAKYDIASDSFPKMLKNFEEHLELMPNLDLKLKYIKKEIERTETTILDWLSNVSDLKDKFLRTDLQAGQKYLEFLRKKEKYPNYIHQDIILPPPAENPEQYNSIVNFESWVEGRIAVIPEGIIVCTNFDELKTQTEHITKSILVLVPDTLSNSDKQKVKDEQTKNSHTHIDNHIDTMIMHFAQDASRVYDKIQFIENEINKYEKLFYEEKFSINNEEAIRKFKNENTDLAHIDIAELRHIFFHKIKKNLFPYSEQRSFKCFFRYHSEDLTLYKSTWAYFRFICWLKKYKAAYQEFFDSISSEVLPPLVRELITLEKVMTDFTIKTKLQNILHLHHELEKEKHNFSINEDGFNSEITDFFLDHYRLELENLKTKIQLQFVLQVSETNKSTVINYVFNQYKSLCNKSIEFRNMLPEPMKAGNESIINGAINIELYQFGKWIKLTFKSYLDPALLFNNTDDKKIIAHFLSSYCDLQTQLNKQIKQDCFHREFVLKSLDGIHQEFTNDFHEQYDFIASKWINQNSNKGNSVNELTFVTGFLKRFESLFKFDKASNTYKAIDYEQNHYSFEKEFFISYMEKAFNFFQNFLKNRFNELNISAVSQAAKKGKSRYQKKVVSTFTHYDLAKNSGTIKPLYNSLRVEFIAPDTHYINFRNIFLNKIPRTKIVWCKGKGTLKYFVRQLKRKEKITNGKIWQAAANSFQIKDEPDYNIVKLSNTKFPSSKNSELRQLDTYINSF